MRSLFIFAVAVLGTPWMHLRPEPAPVYATTEIDVDVDFNRDIRPILADRCFACHGPDAKSRKAKLRLDTFAGATADRGGYAALVPGDPRASEIMKRLRHADAAERMPPARSKLTVSDAEIALIEQWIAAGGQYTRHWAFEPPRRTPVPAAGEGWARDPIDHFVAARAQTQGLSLSPEATRETWLRRVSFALTGIAPTPEEIDGFDKDRSVDAYERAVDKLLASPRHGERMAQDWLDVARYADTYGYQADVDRHVWPYRDWVIDAFNQNLPYDQFLTWQLAGDLLPGATREQRLATAFNRLHRQTNEGGSVEEEYRVEYVADRTETAATAFMGLTVGCAQCHDHKFDPITQADFYRLSAFFDNIDESGLYSHFTRATPTPALSLTNPISQKKIDGLRAEITTATRKLRSVERSRDGAFREWLRTRSPDRAPDVPGRVAHYTLETTTSKGRTKIDLTNAADPKTPARTHDNPRSIDGAMGKGIALNGEDNISFPKVGAFRRTDPFTIALWIRVPEHMERAVVFHRSRAWTDSGSQGYQLLIEDGRLSASLIHFWPGNAIRVAAIAPVETGAWVHVAMSYDGSSRARGLRIYENGAPVPLRTVRDNLYRSIQGGGHVLTIGQRFRDKGFRGGAIDEVQVFRRCLTPIEIAHVQKQGTFRDASDSALREYYLANRDEPTRVARKALHTVRVRLAKELNRVPEIMTMRETAEQRATFILERGSYEARRERVAPGTPSKIAPFPAHLPRNRLGLARWLTGERHPLTARVAVNRLWHIVFGRGLVPTLENFGSQGEPPSHPRVLDRLALDFVASGWNVKAMLKRLVLTATYRQASGGQNGRSVDPENTWLARGPSVRLSAEMLRDHGLHASGLLVEKVGGRSAKPYQPPGLWKEKSGRVYRADKGDGLYRRSLYTFWKRTSPPPSMMIFDAAKRDVCVARRRPTNTPLQALVLLNDPQFVEAARVLAARVLHEAKSTPARIRAAFVRLTSREPTPAETRVLERHLARQQSHFASDPKAAKSLLSVGECRVEWRDPAELAAFAVLCSTMFNYDATVMVR